MKKLLLTICTLLVIGGNAYCTAINSTATGGSFGDTAAWTGGVVPGYGDTATILAGATIYWDGVTRTIGTALSGNNALTINGSFIVPWDCPASTLNVVGNIQVVDGAYGTFQVGYSTNAYQNIYATNTFTVNLISAGTANPRFNIHQGTNGGRAYFYGSIYANQYSTTTTKTITSNFASSASSQVSCVADIDAKPGQQYMIAGTHSTSDTEILTVASYDRATSSITFTSNFTKVHSTGAPIALLSHNIIIKSSSTSTAIYFQKETNTSLANQNVLYMDNVEMTIPNTSQSTYILGTSVTVKNSGFYNCGPFYVYSGNGATFTNCIFAKNYNSGTYLFATDTQGSGVVVDGCYFFSTGGSRAPIYDLGANNTYRNCWFGGASAQAFYSNGCFNTTIENSSFTCIATNIFLLAATNNSATTRNCYYVQLSTNTADANTPNAIIAQNATYREINYTDSGSQWYVNQVATPTSSGGVFTRDADFTSGTIMKFENFNGVTGNDRFYTGSYMVLKDTVTCRTAGSPSINVNVGAYAAYLWNTNPAYVEFPIPCNSGDTVLVRGYARKNSTYGSSNLPSIQAVFSYNLGTTYSGTMTDVSDTWDLINFGTTATSTGTVTIKLYAYNQSRTAGVNAWFDDVRAYIGNNVYSLGKVWANGYPIASPVAGTIDSANVWNSVTSGYASGTMGYNLGNNLDTQISTATAQIIANIDTSSNTLHSDISSIDLSSVTDAIAASSNTLAIQISTSTEITLAYLNTSSNTLQDLIEMSSNSVILAIASSSNTLSTQISTSTIQILTNIDTSSTTLAGDIAGITFDLSPVQIQLSTSTQQILDNIDTSSNTLAGQLAGITIDNTPVLNAISSSSNTLAVQISTSTAGILSAIDTSSTTLSGEISGISVDTTPILNAINTSSNTIVNAINVSSNTLSGEISAISVDVDTSSITNAIWGKTIYGTKSASETLKEIRRREP